MIVNYLFLVTGIDLTFKIDFAILSVNLLSIAIAKLLFAFQIDPFLVNVWVEMIGEYVEEK